MDTSEESSWNFQAGDLALNFANTADWHASGMPIELLNSYADLVDWSRDYNLLSEAEANALRVMARDHEGEAAQALSGALVIRESIYRIFSAVAHKETPQEEDLENLKEALSRAIKAGRIEPQPKGFKWVWTTDSRGNEPLAFDYMLWPVAHAAEALLLSGNLSQVGQCADQRGCGLLFIDSSRNHSRQWCSMDTCGNRAKAQRYYDRSKEK